MINSFRSFAKTKFAGLLVFIMIIPFVFWGMGGMFSSGNTNSIAKINNKNISTKEFMDYLNNSGIPQNTIRENLNDNIIEELLSGLISTTLLELEVKDYEMIISEKTLFKKIKNNKNFHDDNGNFQRTKYEKFLLENNQSAPSFELRLRGRELQKNLFDYIGAGTVSPKFLTEKLYEEENKKLEIDFISLKKYYRDRKTISDNDLKEFIEENQQELKIEYLDFSYAILNPKNLIGLNEFNQSFFDKIDQIEIDISNELEFSKIVSNLNITPVNISNFKYSENKNEVEKKIFQLKNSTYDIFEINDDYVLYKIDGINERKPDLMDSQTKKEIVELVFQKNKFDFNNNLMTKINKKEFNNEDFLNMGQDEIKTIKLNSIKDNKKFDINAVEILYSLPVNSFSLVNDEENNIYLVKIKNFKNELIETDNDKLEEYAIKLNSNNKNTMLGSYDLFLNKKYKVTLNQKTIDRIKNYFQ
tara:strand:- start:980 stop:2398 length:1419 start_codon:yes stop_codon:yes gene_type:complete